MKKGGDSVKRFIYNIVGLLALLFACALPAYAAGPGGYQGSGGYRGSGGGIRVLVLLSESQGYYPYINSCPGGWMKVVPETAPPSR